MTTMEQLFGWTLFAASCVLVWCFLAFTVVHPPTHHHHGYGTQQSEGDDSQDDL